MPLTKNQLIYHREKLGAEKYTAKVLEEMPIGKGLKRMFTDDKKALFVNLTLPTFQQKKKRPFSDYPDLLELQKKNSTEHR